MIVGETVEKSQLVNFISKLMEESGFKVYKDFKTSEKIVDIYGVLPTMMGDFSVVVACKNYDKQWEVGIDIIKEMEMIGRNLKSSKVAIVTSSNFSSSARSYGSRKNIKLIDRDNLIILAKKFSNNEKNIKNSGIKSADSIDRSNSNSEYYEDDDSYQGSENPVSHMNPTTHSSINDFPESRNRFVDDYGYPPSDLGLGRYGSKPNTNSFSKRRNRRNSNLVRSRSNQQEVPMSVKLRPILNKAPTLILLVVLISFLVSSILSLVSGASEGFSGLVKILSALILSYGLVLALNKDATTALLKGTVVFFISLIILILMIILI